MARRKKHEEHVNAEAWAIPYGDLITLLLAFFVVMYSMSSVNEGKYRILSDSLIAAFRGAPTTVAPINVGQASGGKGGDAQLSGVSPTALLKLRDPRPLPEVDEPQEQKGQGDGEGEGTGGTKGRRQGGGPGGRDPRGALFQMADEVRTALQGLIDRDLVRVRQNPLSLEVEIKADILFSSGVATVHGEAVPVIEKVADILRPFPNSLRVEGHTDDRSISTALSPSNWELSSARAANVVQLFTRSGIDPKRMEVLGLGDNRPVASNDTVEGRNANRRVVIVVMQSADPGAPSFAAGALPTGAVAPGLRVEVEPVSGSVGGQGAAPAPRPPSSAPPAATVLARPTVVPTP